MDVIEEGGPSVHGAHSDDDDSGDETGETKRKSIIRHKSTEQLEVELEAIRRSMKGMDGDIRPATLEVLNKVSLTDHPDTPKSTIKRVLKMPKKTVLKFTKDNLKRVEDKLKHAFVEFYHKLKLLKSYRYVFKF